MKTQGKNKFYKMRNVILGLFIALLCFQIESISVSAENEKVIASTTDEGNIYLYLKGISEIVGGTVQIGNKVCENVSIAGMDTFSTPLRTVILIDNSRSIKAEKRFDIQDILTQLVDQSIQGEEYRIGVFSDTITWLSDYSSDYESIKSIINAIQYENQNTYFSDCLYSIIEEMGDNAEAVYSRIIMVSDGADDNSIGYTNYEVSVLAEKSNIPLYMIGTPGDNKALETMFSFARASKADYYLLDGSVLNEDIVAGLLSDHELICMRVTPNVSMLDGGQKNIQVTLNTPGGDIKLTTSVNMPFAIESTSGDGAENNSEQEEQEETSAEPTAQPSLPSLGETAVDTTDGENDGNQGNGIMLFLIIGLVVVLVAVACIVFIVIFRKKKKLNSLSGNSSVQTAVPSSTVDSTSSEQEDKTQFIFAKDTDDGEMTRMLLGQPAQSVWLALKSVERPDKEFRVPMQDVIQIGRKNADIVIDFDQHISTRHCEIIKRGELLYIRDLGSLNGTYYENIRVLDQEIPIVDGGTIKLGNSKFTVSIIKQ